MNTEETLANIALRIEKMRNEIKKYKDKYSIPENVDAEKEDDKGEELKPTIEISLDDFYHGGTTEEFQRKFEEIQARNREWGEQFSTVAGHQRKGIALEKEKDIDGAISEYKQAIANGEKATLLSLNNYLYSMERLMVLYRKIKDYNSEIAIIEKVIQVATEENLYRAEQAISANPERKEAILEAVETCEGLYNMVDGLKKFYFYPHDVTKYKKRLEKAITLQSKVK